MALSGTNRLWKLAEAIRDRIVEKGRLMKIKGVNPQKTRKLIFDPLEERQLLSLSVGTATDILVNTEWQDIRGNSATGYNDSGDAVVAWTAADRLSNPFYSYLNEKGIDPSSVTKIIYYPNDDYDGEQVNYPNGIDRYYYVETVDEYGDVSLNYVEDLNIYARYLTDEVQVITLPTTNVGGKFYMLYGANEVQRLSFFAATEQYTDSDYYIDDEGNIVLSQGEKISGTVDLQLYSLQNGEYISFTYQYDQNLLPEENAANLQKAIRRVDPEFADFEVTAYSDTEFDITYNYTGDFEKYKGTNVAEMKVAVGTSNFESGFIAGAIVTTISEPTLITNYSAQTSVATGIVVDSDPLVTAANIQKAFNAASGGNVLYAPTERIWVYDEATHLYISQNTPTKPLSSTGTFKTIDVKVLPVEGSGGMQFYITFTGNSGLSDQQELLISTNKTQWTGSSDFVKTIKQSSPVFRVNAPEKTEISEYSTESYYKIEVYTKDLSGQGSFKTIYNVELPEIVQTGKTNQSRPAVTMDNDGEFTIAWQSAVDDVTDTMNTYDIYARRFTVQGIVDDTEYKELVGFYVDGGWEIGSTYVPVSANDLFSSYDYGDVIQTVQGVRPLGEEFRINATTNGAQTDPAIDSDDDGNFVISWTTDGQYESYFGGIVARWYGKDGLSISGEVYVSYIDNPYGVPHYGKSQVAVSPEGYVVITYDWSNSSVYKSVYAPGSTTPFVDDELVSQDAYGSSVDFDDNGRYVLAYTSTAEEGAWPYYTDVMAQYFMISRSDDGVYSETALTGALMVNNADNSNWTDHDGDDIIYCNQSGVSVGMDADGDTFYAFQGFGIDYQSGQQIYSRNDEGDNRFDTSRDIYLTVSDFVDNNLIYGEDHAVWVNGKWAYPCKNIDLYRYLPDILERASGYIYDDEGYIINYNYGSGTDVDTYIRACLVAARKLFEADSLTEADILDKLSRLNAALEYQLQYLRGDSSGILYSRFGHSPRDITNDDNSNNTNDNDDSETETNLMETAFYVNTGFVSGTVNNARDGSNCHFYVLVPFASNLASASLTLYLERLVENRLVGAEVSVTVDAALYADTNIFDQGLFADNLASNLNDIAKYNTGWDGSFVVNVIDDINYYDGTEYEFPYSDYVNSYDWAVFEVICQQGVHDTPMQIWTTDSVAVNTADVEGYIRVLTSQTGDYGKKQINAQTSMTSSGNVIVTWQNQSDQNSYYYNNSGGGEYAALGNPETIISEQIYIRSFKESTDTAGATVTQVALADGSRIEDGDTLTSAIKNLIVTFDEELMTTETYTNAYGQLHSVDNVNNWVLQKDGVVITNAIESIQFGFSATKELARNATDPRVNKSVLTLGSNKWEAIITFADGYEPTSGTYTLALKNAVQDTSRNAMYSNGVRREGQNFEISFQVMPLNEPLGFEEFEAPQSPEQSLTDSTTANQVTRSDITSGLTADSPNTANAVASDANGNFVSVWTSEGEGIYAAVYRQYYILDATRQRVLKSEEIAKFLVAKDGQTYAESEYTDLKQASVAMDDLGRFMVVWDALDANGDRNVYARHFHFDSVGTITSLDINDFVTTDTNPFRINIETEEAQQNAAIAMDSDGDIAVVWESYEQDGSGWGIIGRRFYTDNKECVSFGRTNAQQLVTIGGTVETGASSYTISGVVNGIAFTTDTISLYQGTARNIDAIREALLAVTYTDQGQEVNVFELGDFFISAYSSNQLLIDFAGKYAYNNIDTFYGEIKTGTNTIDFSLINNGAAGAEFVVNETTANNQRFASVGMNADGSFVVSWTSWGQDQDDWYESNIYAKQFVSNHSLRNTSTVISTYNASMSDQVTPTMIVNDEDVSQYEITDQSYAGVVQILIGGTDDETNNDDTNDDNDNADTSLNGTGTLLISGCHILTAAHVVWDEAAAEAYDPSEVFIKFELEDGIVKYYEAAAIYVHPSYMGNVTTDVDLAIIQLREVAPEGVQGYDINRDSDELGQVFTKLGYGYAGQGDDTADELVVRTYGDKVRGQNVYEVTGSDVNTLYRTSGLIAYDFDDGTRKNDYFGNNLGIRDLGLGKTEAIAAPGDSGGPSLINGKIAGVTSFIVGTTDNNDETYGPTAGAVGIDVRVSTHSDWIDSILVGGMGTEFLVSTDANNTVLIDSTDDESTGDDTTDDDTTILTNDVAQNGDQIWSSVAIDSSGNFVISWTGYAQDANGDADTGTTANGLGAIYARRYFNAGASTVLTGPVFLVNDYTENDQVHSQVVMSSSGDFTIVWESYQDNQYLNDVTRIDPPASYGIYAKRFINTNVYIDALVALNTTTTTDDDTTNNDDDTNTTAIGDDNTDDDNSNDDNAADDETPIMTIFPSIPGGTTSLTIENVGTVGLEGERGSEFRINQTILANQLGGSVAMNNNGDIIFVWTDAYDQNLQGDLQYVIEWTGLDKVNFQNFYQLTLTIGDEVYTANVQLKNNAADTTQAVIDALYDNLIDSDGNVVALFDRNAGDLDKSYSENGETIIVFSSDSVQPDYLTGKMSPEMVGINAILSKTSYTQVRYRTIILSSDDMPPYVTAVDANYTVDSVEKSISLFNSKVIFAEDCGPISLTYDFSELMNSTDFMNYLRTLDSINHFEADLYISQSGQWDTGTKSVLNVSNWTLLKDGIAVTSSYIKSLAYDTSTGLLTMTFTQQLGKGVYILTLKDNVTDLFSNKLDGDYDYIEGGSFTVRFNVGISISGGSEDDTELKEDLVYSNRYYGHSQPAVASRSYTTYDPNDWTKTITSTEFVVVSTVSYTDSDTTNDTTNDDNTNDTTDDTNNSNNEYSDIVIRKYVQEDGQFIPAGTETIVNVYTNGNQMSPDVAMSDYGDYVVVWTGTGRESQMGAFARFYPDGSAQAVQVFVSSADRLCYDAKVTIDSDLGLVLITWREGSKNYTIEGDKVLGRYYNLSGKALGNQFELLNEGVFSVVDYDIDSTNIDGEDTFVVTWSVLNAESRYDKDVYAKSFQTSSVYTPIETLPKFRVNQTILGAQYDPQVAVETDGDFHIVWVNTLDGLTDIYGRSYQSNGTSKTLLGTTNEVLINVTTANRQFEPALSVSPDGGGLVVTYTSFDSEPYNYDEDTNENLHDESILARVLTASADGFVAIDNTTLKAMVSYLTLSPNEENKNGEFLVNQYYNKDQYESAISVYGCGSITDGTTSIPLFVTAWTGPNPLYGSDLANDDNSDDNDTDDNTSDNDDNETYSPTDKDVYFMTFPTSTFGNGSNVPKVEDGVVYLSTVSRFNENDDDIQSGANGFYRPVETSTDSSGIVVDTTTAYIISGTNDDDVLSVSFTNSGWDIKLNGIQIEVPSGTKEIAFNGLNGSDKVQFTGTNRAETVIINAATETASFAGIFADGSAFTLSASKIEKVFVDGQAGSDSVTLYTSRGNDTIIAELATVELVSAEFEAEVLNFEKVAFRSTAGSDYLLLKDSEEDDVLTLSNNYAKLVAADYTFEAKGFSSVKAISSSGNDFVSASGVKSLYSIVGAVIAQTANSTNTIVGFDAVSANAIAASSATIFGSTGNDIYRSLADSSEFFYSDQTKLTMSGFKSVAIYGNGGYDVAVMSSGNQNAKFIGKEKECQFGNSNFSNILNNFSHVIATGLEDAFLEATLYDTTGNDTLIKKDNSAVMKVNDNDLYSLLAFDVVKTQNDKGIGTDVIFDDDEWNVWE
ncbi:MAG: trypsin-like serine protease [Planctomycetia bacterium]|nr:trypsin-like serine protease [Planctomycetia bacterium]